MATKHPKSAQTGESGVTFVRNIVTQAGGIFRSFDYADLGIDGAIELLTDSQEPSGDIVLVQVKAGASYIRNGRFYVDAGKDHFESWSRYGLTVVGIVCNVGMGEARCVDISDHLRNHPEVMATGPYSIEAPACNVFSLAGFPQFVIRFRRPVVVATRVDVTPNLLIRAWEPKDANPVRVLLSTIAPDYPDFDGWLKGKFRREETSKKVVVVGNAIAAFSMWQHKDERNIKLQTFMVGPTYRGTGIGQHLLYHELRPWAEDPKVERVFVTVATSKADLIAYLRGFGFRVEGIAANRYPRPSAELILAKHFLRKTVRTPAALQEMAGTLAKQFWGITIAGACRFGVAAADFAVTGLLPQVTMMLNSSEATVAPRLELKDASGNTLLWHDDESLMREFYPLRLHLKNKRYVLVPIYPKWAEAMLSTSGPETPLKLRIDHVYYCFPKVSNLANGDFVLFYETKTGGGRGAAIGAGVVQEVAVDTPAVLFARFSNLGIYKLSDVDGRKNRRGHAKAIKFALFEPFLRPVPLSCVPRHLGHPTTVQGPNADPAGGLRGNPFTRPFLSYEYRRDPVDQARVCESNRREDQDDRASQIFNGSREPRRGSCLRLRARAMPCLLFRIRSIETLPVEEMWKRYHSRLGIGYPDYAAYFNGLEMAVGVHVGEVHDLAPIPLREIEELAPGFVPPQGIIWLRDDFGKYRKLISKLSCPVPADVFPQQSLRLDC